MAIVFTRSLDAAKNFDATQAALTLCLYQDGTPPGWMPGAGDCFGDHQGFSERIEAGAAARPREEPAELRRYLAAREACASLPASTVVAGPGVEFASMRTCPALPRIREELLQKKLPNEMHSH